MINVGTEHPYLHWRYIDVENRIVLDLGCGRWSSQDKHLSTAEFFIRMGAKRVIGVDCDNKEITALQEKLTNDSLYEL
jgi:predicted RNA methylase